MLCLKLLCASALVMLVFAAPEEANKINDLKKRVERFRRQLFNKNKDVESNSKLDLENDIPLKVVEKSLELNDGKGDNEVNGSKVFDDKNVKYFHQKHKGTVKTIVEEKNNEDNKMENVFYHLSYEKNHPEQDTTAVPELEETTLDTTDQTLDYDTTLPEDETTTQLHNVDYYYVKQNNNNDDDDSIDQTVPSEEFLFTETPIEEETEQVNVQNAVDNAVDNTGRNAGWFSNWLNWLSNPNGNDQDEEQHQSVQNDYDNSDALKPTPDLDTAIASSQFTILSPFYFGSVGLRSQSCPPHRPTLISIYFVSFCI